MTKIVVTYLGPASVVIAGRHLMSGESRLVEDAYLDEVLQYHPAGDFMVDGKPLAQPEPGEEVAQEANPLDALTVADIKEAAQATEDVAYLQALLEMEQAGQARKTAVKTIADRISELTAPPEPDTVPHEDTE